MNDISIKVLSALYDLCDDDSYKILDADDITAKLSDAEISMDELTEVIENFAADGMLELKYADNAEYCLALRTKGRNLVKQSRDRLNKLEEEAQLRIMEEATTKSEAEMRLALLESEKERLRVEMEADLQTAKQAVAEAKSRAEKLAAQKELKQIKEVTSKKEVQVSNIETQIAEFVQPTPAAPDLTKGYQVNGIVSTNTISQKQMKKLFWTAFCGAAIGAILVNLVFAIIFFANYVK